MNPPESPAVDDLRHIFPADGEMAELIRAKDWTETPLGHPRDWPDSLVMAVNILLGSRYPMEIWWGPEYLRFYNDAYRPLLGPNRHPQFLGRPGQECWAELWDVIGPMLEGVRLTGKPTYAEDSLLVMTRKGFPEETYVSWSYGPIRARDGTIGGIFCACDETTRKVLAQRRLATLHELGLGLRVAKDGLQTATEVIGKNAADIPFALVCRGDQGCRNPSLLVQVGIPEAGLARDAVMAACSGHWPVGPGSNAGTPIVLEDPLELSPEASAAWENVPRKAVLFPITARDGSSVAIIFGVSARLDLDQEYVDFLTLVARHLSTTFDFEYAQKEIEGERLRLRAAFMKSPAFMCVLNGPSHVFDFVNEQYYGLVGEREILGKPVAEALPEIVEQGFIDLLDTVYRTGQPYVGSKTPVRLQREQGQPMEDVVIDFVYQPIQMPDGSVSGIFVHGIDITEELQGQQERERLLESERTARSQAERAGRMKDEFLATLSHELRTPLNAILGWATILRSEPSSEPAEGLEIIERNARAQSQIIEDLLDMSRIISGKVRLDVQRVDLPEVLKESLDTVRATAEAKGIRLQQVLDPLASPVSGDPSRLQQIFWNLLNNAIKFTDRGGRIQVLLERVNSHIEISVIDSGQGISPEFLPQVFDRFQQADSSTTRSYGGLGLGLAIVKQLVELHGGSVRAKSGGPGQGATFIVNLPLTVVHQAHENEPARRHPRHGRPETELHPISLGGVRVLAVDDEPDARALVQRLLEQSGAAVKTAGSAAVARSILELEPFDVLVCDIGMPGEDGYSLIRSVRALENTARGIPAVALTAYARSGDRTHALRAGFQMHIAKPVEPAELVAVVATLAQKH